MRISMKTLPILLTGCVLLGTSPARTAEAGSLRAGAAKLDITPGDFKGFYSVWAKPFERVLDPIFVRALVLDNGTTRAAIVATDLVEFGDTLALRQRIQRELAIPADHVMVSASHDHNAPRAGPIAPGTSSAEGRPYSPPAYVQLVDDRIVEALRKALAAAQPARMGTGTGRADVNMNRNGFNGRGFGGADPDGPSDKTVWVIKFETPSGQPIAMLLNYGVHSTVAGPANTFLTGDLAGAAERAVERHFDDRMVALWTMGPAGDQNPRYTGNLAAKDVNGDFAREAMNAQGLMVAAEAIQTAARITHMESSARIDAAESAFTCAVIPPKPRPANAGPSPFAPNPDFKEVVAKPTEMKIILNLIRINETAIAGVSGEIFTRIYWRLRRESPLSNTVLVTMSNGRIGYIGDDAAYDGPFTNPSVVRGCAEDGIVNGLVRMIGQQR